MANSIATFKKYIDLLDEVYKQASLTAVLESDATTGKIVRKPQTGWAAVVAAEEGVPFCQRAKLSLSQCFI